MASKQSAKSSTIDRKMKFWGRSPKFHFRPDHVLDYFKEEWFILLLITFSGVIYNVGLLAGPWFEGKLAECLLKILKGSGTFSAMLTLVLEYVAAISIVQIARYIKRFYVRRFANNVNRRMKEILYGSLVRKSRAELEQEGEGNLITKAISDVDDCVEGMRKFTTEIYDTGLAMIGYVCMLLYYDWRLGLLCLIFPPISFAIAEKMKVIIQKTGSLYKKKTGELSSMTLDRVTNAITYRVYGCEPDRLNAYEYKLCEYEKTAIKSNIWSSSLQPLYQIISMASVIFILYFGSANVLHHGWSDWSIAAFTTFLACYTKLSVKSSKTAKLFNAVHKAQVSWKRIKPFMESHDSEADIVPSTNKQMCDSFQSISEQMCGASQSSNKEMCDSLQSISEQMCDSSQSVSEQMYDSSLFANKQMCGAFQSASSKINLKIRNLTFAYVHGDPIISGINLQAHAGQVIGVTGPVACGKSTFGKTFLCEYPYEGSILVDGMELGKLAPEEIRRYVGYLGHDPELLNDTIENNVMLGTKEVLKDGIENNVMLGTEEGLSGEIEGNVMPGTKEFFDGNIEDNIWTEEKKNKDVVSKVEHSQNNYYSDIYATHILHEKHPKLYKYLSLACFEQEVSQMEQGVETIVGSGGLRLSGGQAQRLALARTMLHKKPLLILDDPCSALDGETERKLFSNLRTECKDSIILFISHRLSLFPEMDQVIWMEKDSSHVGTKIEVGRHEELLGKVPLYRELYYDQTGVTQEHYVEGKRCVEDDNNLEGEGCVEDDNNRVGEKCVENEKSLETEGCIEDNKHLKGEEFIKKDNSMEEDGCVEDEKSLEVERCVEDDNRGEREGCDRNV